MNNYMRKKLSTSRRYIAWMLQRKRTSGPPIEGLLCLIKAGVDTIGLSVDDYSALPATWQVVFFTDADTPILHTGPEWMAILLAHPGINTSVVLAVEDGGALVYEDDTAQAILDAGLAYLQGLVLVTAGDYATTDTGDYPTTDTGDYATI